jgi:hypothetical protein
MKIGDLIRRKRRVEINPEDAFGIITAGPTLRKTTGQKLFYVRFPSTGRGQWYHPTRLVVISENR